MKHVSNGWIAAIAIAATSALAGCGGSATQPPASRHEAAVITGGTNLVRIGGGRSLAIECAGTGSPAVVLEAGFGGASTNWSAVQPEIARTTRTCAYDRAGLGSSVALPGVHDARAEIADLAKLLASAQIPPPYVLVGHSYGGLLVRLFARAHPQQTAGVVLVDSMGRDQTRRQLAIWPKSLAPSVRRDIAAGVTDGVDLHAGEVEARSIRSLGWIPLAVVTAGTHAQEWSGLPAPLPARFARLWTTMQDELAGLSSNHVHVVAQRSDHFVQGANGQPGVVIRAVNAVVTAARQHQPLPGCAPVFSGLPVRCP